MDWGISSPLPSNGFMNMVGDIFQLNSQEMFPAIVMVHGNH